jgi:hypothetical protein
MWSNDYWYFTILKDRLIYEDLSINLVQNLLLETESIEQISYQEYKNIDGFLWLNLTVMHSQKGNFSVGSIVPNKVNLISIIGSKRGDDNLEKYIEILLPIANKLKWRFFIEEDDEGNEYVEIIG